MIGTVKKWVDDKGFGFISNPNGGKDIFVHCRDIVGKGRKTLEVGQKVEFQTEDTEKGVKAIHVVPN